MRRCNDELTTAIAGLTTRVWLYRLVRRDVNMPIKWNITAKATKARGIMDQISAEYDGFIESGSEHLSDVKGLRSQVGGMQDDLQAAANVMGNSSGVGVEPVETPQPSHAPFGFDPAKVVQQPPAAPPAVILNGSPGMQGTHDVQLIRS